MSEISNKYTGLILISGADAPGVTQALFETLSPFSVSILDMEQVIIRGRLILTTLIELHPDHQSAIEEDLMTLGQKLAMDIAVDFSTHDVVSRDDSSRLQLVVLAKKLYPKAIASVAAAINKHGGNVDRFRRTAAYPVTSIEFDVALPQNQSVQALKSDLAELALREGITLSIEAGGLTRRSKRIVLLDMDSTFIQQEVIDLLAEKAGVLEAVARITNAAMRGEVDFAQSLTERVALLKGLSENVFKEVAEQLVLTPGARTLVRTLHRMGHKVGIVSGGFTNVIEPLIRNMKVDFFKANTLEVVDGHLTGRVIGPIIDRPAKAQALREFSEQESVPLSHAIAVGDGANDLDMIREAGLGIAFNAKPSVRTQADSALDLPYLDAILYLIGIPREEIEAADRELTNG